VESSTSGAAVYGALKHSLLPSKSRRVIDHLVGVQPEAFATRLRK
jgi:hypothetical protein